MAKFHGLLLVSAVLGLIFMLLSGNVSRQRFLTRVMIGDGDGQTGAETLRKAVRTQANFAEYVPLILFLLAGDAFAGASAKWVVWPGIALVLARLSHAAGMYRPAPNPLRAGGAMLTWAVLILASLEAFYLTF